MRFFRSLLFALCFLYSVPVICQENQKFITDRDLGNDWIVQKAGVWEPWAGTYAKVIYLTLPANVYSGKYLQIKSFRDMEIFVGQKLVAQKHNGTILLNADSLAHIYSSGLTIALYQKDGINLSFSRLVIPFGENAVAEGVTVPRKGEFFLNFSILAVLLLAAAFILLFRNNPRLTLDYLNVPRLFSIQEREDSLLTTRVTSSINLLFYLFCSAYFGYALLVIFHLGADEIASAAYFQVHSVADGFLQWIKLITIIAGCLGLKLVLISTFSFLFKMKDSSALQFFNFIRMIFFITILISAIGLGYFVYYGYLTGPHAGLLKMGMIVMSISVVMVFLKLLTFAPFSFFHLFSYLCASEIIPLVILLKILL